MYSIKDVVCHPNWSGGDASERHESERAMNHPTILVTAATGKTGSAVVTQLRERGWPVRALVRTSDERSARLERLGAELIVADLYDPDDLLRAMRGATRAYYCPPMSPFMIQSAAAFAVAAREAKLDAIVGMTQWLASPSHLALLTRQHWLADNLFSSIPGLAYVAINPGYFADNYLTGNLMQFAAQLGIFPWPYGSGKNAPPSNDDIARVAVAALVDPAPHVGRAYRPTGPELLDGTEMAAILSRVLGRDVKRFDMSEVLFLKAVKHAGYSTFVQNEMRRYTKETANGAWEVNGPSTDLRPYGTPAGELRDDRASLRNRSVERTHE